MTVRSVELSDGARVHVEWLGVRRLPGERDTVATYRLRFYAPAGALLFDDSTLTLPYRDDERALRDGAGFLSAYGDASSGAGTYVPELASWADGLSMVADEMEE